MRCKDNKKSTDNRQQTTDFLILGDKFCFWTIKKERHLHRSFFLKITYYRKYHDLTYNHFLVTTSIFCFHDNQINSGIASLVYAYFARSVVCLIH